MRKAVFLDRDGVINKTFIKDDKPYAPLIYEELEILPGVKESIVKLKNLNFICLVVTNQPDVSRGKIKKETVIKMNNFLKEEIKLDDFFVCYHDDQDDCKCRKPKSGLLIDAAKKWDVDFKKSYMIGDRWKDVEAGFNVGCKTIFINNNYKETKKIVSNFTTTNLINAVYIIEKN
jgi:D-glycero-D-manno-heptose 1,7-bisphosphate phosphatase